MSPTKPAHNPDSPLPAPLPGPAYTVCFTPGHPVITIWPTKADALGHLIQLRRHHPTTRSIMHTGPPSPDFLQAATSSPCTIRDHRPVHTPK